MVFHIQDLKRHLNALFVTISCCLIVSPCVAESNLDRSIVNRAVEVAGQLFKSANPYDQISGAGTLTDIGDANALKVLITYAESEDFVYQRSAIDTLTHVQHPRGLDAVYRIAANTPQALHFLTQSLATNPREEMGEFLVGVLTSDKPLIQQYALQALVQIPDADAIEATKALVGNKSTRRSTKAYGYYLLASRGLGAEVEPDLMELIRLGDMDAKEVAAVALAYVPGDEARRTIKKLTQSEDARVQLAALATDASFGNTDSLKEFSRIITHGKNMN
ncbi:MAG: HEAT repeat domain-containing protein, partial [Gammaproteobacteria bacterium]